MKITIQSKSAESAPIIVDISEKPNRSQEDAYKSVLSTKLNSLFGKSFQNIADMATGRSFSSINEFRNDENIKKIIKFTKNEFIKNEKKYSIINQQDAIKINTNNTYPIYKQNSYMIDGVLIVRLNTSNIINSIVKKYTYNLYIALLNIETNKIEFARIASLRTGGK